MHQTTMAFGLRAVVTVGLLVLPYNARRDKCDNKSHNQRSIFLTLPEARGGLRRNTTEYVGSTIPLPSALVWTGKRRSSRARSATSWLKQQGPRAANP